MADYNLINGKYVLHLPLDNSDFNDVDCGCSRPTMTVAGRDGDVTILVRRDGKSNLTSLCLDGRTMEIRLHGRQVRVCTKLKGDSSLMYTEECLEPDNDSSLASDWNVKTTHVLKEFSRGEVVVTTRKVLTNKTVISTRQIWKRLH